MLNPQNQVIARNILEQCNAERDRCLEHQKKKYDRARFLTQFEEFARNIVRPAVTEVNNALQVDHIKLELCEAEYNDGVRVAFRVTPSPAIQFNAESDSAIVQIKSFWPKSRKRSAAKARFEDHFGNVGRSIDELTVRGEVEGHLLRFIRTSMDRISFPGRRVGPTTMS